MTCRRANPMLELCKREPARVGTAIVERVETPAGQRPLRALVGEVPAASAMNRAANRYARALPESFALGT